MSLWPLDKQWIGEDQTRIGKNMSDDSDELRLLLSVWLFSKSLVVSMSLEVEIRYLDLKKEIGKIYI